MSKRNVPLIAAASVGLRVPCGFRQPVCLPERTDRGYPGDDGVGGDERALEVRGGGGDETVAAFRDGVETLGFPDDGRREVRDDEVPRGQQPCGPASET